MESLGNKSTERCSAHQGLPPVARGSLSTAPSAHSWTARSERQHALAAGFLCGGERRTPRGPLPALNPLELWRRPPGSGLRATWLGHSTLLIDIARRAWLTDPVWGPRASPSRLAGPKRFQPVPVSPARHASGGSGYRFARPRRSSGLSEPSVHLPILGAVRHFAGRGRTPEAGASNRSALLNSTGGNHTPCQAATSWSQQRRRSTFPGAA